MNLSIKVIVAERPYFLTIHSEEEEETVRAASKLINNNIKQYQRVKEYKDYQDLLAMCSLHLGTALLELQRENSQYTRIIKELKNIDQYLAEYIEKI